MTYQKALDKLFSMHQFSIKLGLENIQRLAKTLGNPQKSYKCFHIAGSNGKGSTASFLASILTEMGFKTGLYTSPHLVRFNERIRVNGVEISDDYIAEFMSGIDDYVDNYKPTFFEITTALAFKYFQDEKVDYAVVETGLGGRLDATNIIDPSACLITSISLEHTNILGEDIKLIAREKAGIIKENSKIFLSNIPEEAITEIDLISESKHAEVTKLMDYISINKESVKLADEDFTYTIDDVNLFGNYQFVNFALAILAIKKTIGFDNIDVLNRAVKNLIKNSGLQGRGEIFSKEPLVIFDAAHNSESLNQFIKEYNKRFKTAENHVIFGMMKDKNVKEMVEAIAHNFDYLYVSSVDFERAISKTELVQVAENIGKFALPLEKPVEFIRQFILEKKKGSSLVVFGSIYLIGEIKSQLQGILS